MSDLMRERFLSSLEGNILLDRKRVEYELKEGKMFFYDDIQDGDVLALVVAAHYVEKHGIINLDGDYAIALQWLQDIQVVGWDHTLVAHLGLDPKELAEGYAEGMDNVRMDTPYLKMIPPLSVSASWRLAHMDRQAIARGEEPLLNTWGK